MHCHKETEKEPVEPLDATALAPLTDVQGHALLGVGLQLVVVDGHLPLEQQDSRAVMEPRAPAPSLRRPICPAVCGHQRALGPVKGLLLLSLPTRPWPISKDKADRVPGATERTAWRPVTLRAPALPHATATPQTSAGHFPCCSEGLLNQPPSQKSRHSPHKHT